MQCWSYLLPLVFINSIFDKMNFLKNILREKGEFDYKMVIIDFTVIFICEIPDAMESGISHFVSLLKTTNSPTSLLLYIYIYI